MNRYQHIVELRAERRSFPEIARILSISPSRARQIFDLGKLADKAAALAKEFEATPRPLPSQFPVSRIPLTTRARHLLNCENITVIGQLVEYSDDYFREIPNCGAKTLAEVRNLRSLINPG